MDDRACSELCRYFCLNPDAGPNFAAVAAKLTERLSYLFSAPSVDLPFLIQRQVDYEHDGLPQEKLVVGGNEADRAERASGRPREAPRSEFTFQFSRCTHLTECRLYSITSI